MRVADYMTDVVLYAAPDDGVRSAYDTLQKARLHHLPVIDRDGVLRGVVSDRDLRRPRWADADEAAGAPYLLGDHVTVGEVMSASAVTVHPDDPLVDAARLFVEHRFGALPVMHPEQGLVGILSPIDVMWALIDTFGGRAR